MRRAFLILPVFALLALGCGDGTDAPEADATAEATPAPEAPPTSCPEGELVVENVTEGTGAEATVEDVVTINYVGTFEDGTQFDANEGVEYPLANFVPGFRDGVAGMKVGGTRRLVIPANDAYGVAGSPPVIPPCADLHFEIDLLGVR